jgi:hypothetical protein
MTSFFLPRLPETAAVGQTVDDIPRCRLSGDGERRPEVGCRGSLS